MINSRAKGKKAELEACRFLEKILGGQFRRTQQHRGVSGAADIEGCNGLSIEVKNRQAFNLYAALEQATASAKQGEVPFVLYWNNRGRKVAILYADDLEQFANTITTHIHEKNMQTLPHNIQREAVEPPLPSVQERPSHD